MVAPQYLVCGRQRNFFFSSISISLKQISGTPFSVSGQRCGQAKFITVTQFGRGTRRALVVVEKKQPAVFLTPTCSNPLTF